MLRSATDNRPSPTRLKVAPIVSEYRFVLRMGDLALSEGENGPMGHAHPIFRFSTVLTSWVTLIVDQAARWVARRTPYY